MHRILRTTLLLTAVSAGPLVAQTAAMGPPPVLWIQRELVKPGKSYAHNNWEKGWPAAFGKANWPTTYIAMNAISGASESWFLIGYPSFDAMEKDLAQTDANAPLTAEMNRLSAGETEFVETTRGVLAQFVPSLSYRPGVDLSKMRFFEVITYVMKPGHEADFAKAATLYRDGFTKGNIEGNWSTYRVASGLAEGTYLVFIPMRSLSALDIDNMPAMSRALGPDQMSALGKLVSDGVATSQRQIFSLNPKASYVSKEMKAADAFWR